MKFLASAAAILACVTLAVNAASTPRSQYIARELALTVSDSDGIEYWRAGAVVDGHNDAELELDDATADSIAATYDQCLEWCREHKCSSFDMAFDKKKCYFDLKTPLEQDVLFHPDAKHPERPVAKEDLTAAYVKMSANPAPAESA